MKASLPPELEKFCSEPGRSLLVKGGPGTGKTLLSFELLQRFSQERSTYYISTRVSPERLLKENPHLRKVLKAQRIPDVAKPDEAVTSVYDLTMVDISTFVDRLYRLTEEIVTPFVVVDSWSGIANALDSNERLKAEESLVSLCRKANAFVTFVSEEPEQSTVDYLVDGVVELRRSNIEGRPVRYLQLTKLRSTKISQSRYVFTLGGGRFSCFSRFALTDEWKKGNRESLEERTERFSTGSQDLDGILGGGFPKGSTVLLEIGEDVPAEGHYAITYMVSANSMGHGRGVVVIPNLGYPFEEEITLAESVFGKDKARQLLRFVGVRGPEDGILSPYVVPLPIESAREDYETWTAVHDVMMKETGQPTLQITGMDRQESRYGTEEYRVAIGYSVDKMRESGSVEIRISKPGMENLTQRASNVSNIHLKLVSLYGTVLFYAKKPWTGLYALQPVIEGGFSKLLLAPIV